MSRLNLKFVWVLLLVFLAGCQTQPETYTVIHQDYDGTIIQEMSVEAGESVMPPTDPLREGYEFTGWDNSPDAVQADLIITATYEEVPEETPESENQDSDNQTPEIPEIAREDRPILVLTYVEGLEKNLERFLDHPFVITDTVIDVDYTDYSRMLVLYNDNLRRVIPPRLLGRPGLDENHFVTFENEEDFEVTMVYLEEKSDFERFFSTVDISIFEIRDDKSVYDYYPIGGQVIIDASSRFDATALQDVLGEDVSIIDSGLSDDVLLNETIYAFIGNRVPTSFSKYDDILMDLDQAATVIELERGQKLIVGRATGEWADEYYADFVRQAKSGIMGKTSLTLSPPEGIVVPTPRPVSADTCYIEDVRGPESRRDEATVSNFIPEYRISALGDVNALGIMIKFEDVAMVQSEEAFRDFLNEVHAISEDYFKEVSHGQMNLNWTLHPELVEVPFFITPELQPWNPQYEILIHEHIVQVLEIVETQTDLTDIDMINFYWPAGLPDYVYGGLSAMVDEPLPTERGAIYNYSVKKMETKYFGEPRQLARSVYHGVAHNLGLRDIYIHEGAFEGDMNTITYKYGHWDVMTAADNELNAWHRWILKWMTDDQVHCQPVASNQTYEVFLEPLNQPEASTRQIVIPLSRSQALSIELRDPGKYCPEGLVDVGFFRPQGGCTQNVLVTHIDTSIRNGLGPMTILRTARSTAVDFSDALMLEGEFVTFENITITHKARYAKGSVIEITVDD